MSNQQSVKKGPVSIEQIAEMGEMALFPQRGSNVPQDASEGSRPAAAEKAAARKKKTKVKKELGSSRGIETMFRTAYRAQLDLTALAATKANIMISLNGLILSVLTLSGPFVLVAEPMFTAPIAVFLATCLTSIIFAVLAAQPKFAKSRCTLDQFKRDEANILVFEHFSSLDIAEHTKVMTGLLRNNTRIYKNMSRQLYLLGIDAHRKFRLLKYSYTAFLVGLTVSTLMLLAVGFLYQTQDLNEIMGSLQSRAFGLQQSQ
ncbi:MAG: DUF5706 domain-containing protein [Gammaproteobacteria bacterium]|nr:DUF5706 domain-containing protein [Gammaproteobacteria bacterium]